MAALAHRLTNFDYGLRGVGIFGAGLNFGGTYLASAVCIPILFRDPSLTARQRVTLWDHTFNLAVRWIPASLISNVCFFVAAYRSRGAYRGSSSNSSLTSTQTLLAAGSLLLVQGVYTALAIVPSIKALKSLRTKAERDEGLKAEEEQQVDTLIKTWEFRHRPRILLSGAAFALGIFDLIQLSRL